jgi:hypothetical protein
MDGHAFGELTKRIAGVGSRRGMVGALLAGVAGPLLAERGWYRVAAAGAVEDEAFGFCRAGGFPCGKDQQCCTHKCLDDGTCDCAPKGKSCLNRVGVNCCSKKCRKGKCL